MNDGLDRLQPYPFERIAALRGSALPPDGWRRIALGIGEPQDPPPEFILGELAAHAADYGRYPATKGTAALRNAAANWLTRRYDLAPNAVDAERHVLPVAGTREALFAAAQCLARRGGLVAMPSPGYQIYEGAALLAGAEPYYLPCRAELGWQTDFQAVPDNVWARTSLLYWCSPGNPTGAVTDVQTWALLLALADRHDFVICADECYAELYADDADAPPGLLQAAAATGRHDFRRCLVFHSLSKRSHVPGLRSGFVAGDAVLLESFLRYRTYHGCAMPLPVQAASAAAWQDDEHVAAHRALYRDRFAAMVPILAEAFTDVRIPRGGFYLWLAVPDGDDVNFARRAWQEAALEIVPGSYLGRAVAGTNPGAGYVRISLVATLADCIEAAHRLVTLARP
jgi:N-succinyldiaminopimelate aminotransferase